MKGSENLGKLSSRNKKASDLKVGKSLAVERTKFSINELHSNQPPKVAFNNFYQHKLPQNLKFAQPPLHISPSGPQLKKANLQQFHSSKKENKIQAIKSARSSIRLEEPEQEQMEGVIEKRGTEPMKEVLKEVKQKPRILMKPLPVVPIKGDQEAASKFQECQKYLNDAKLQTLAEVDWQKQNDSCITLRSLCIQNQAFLKKEQTPLIHDLLPSLVDLMRSPRSVLAKSAITTVAFIVRAMSEKLEQSIILENILHTLFFKVADKIKFLSSAAEHAIKIVVGHVADQKVFQYALSFQPSTKAVESRWAVALALKLIIEKKRSDFFEMKCADSLLKFIVDLTSDPALVVRNECKSAIQLLSKNFVPHFPDLLRPRLNEDDYKKVKKILTNPYATGTMNQSTTNLLAFSISKASFLTQTGGMMSGRSKSASGARRDSDQEKQDLKLTQEALLSKSRIEESPLKDLDTSYMEKVEAEIIKLCQATYSTDWRKRLLGFKKLTNKLSKNGGLYHKLEKQGKTKKAIFESYMEGIKDTNINVIQGVFDLFLHIAFLLRRDFDFFLSDILKAVGPHYLSMFPRVKLSSEKLLKQEVFRTLKPAVIVECICDTISNTFTILLQSSLIHVLIDFIRRHSTQNQEILNLIKAKILPFIYTSLIPKEVPQIESATAELILCVGTFIDVNEILDEAPDGTLLKLSQLLEKSD